MRLARLILAFAFTAGLAAWIAGIFAAFWLLRTPGVLGYLAASCVVMFYVELAR